MTCHELDGLVTRFIDGECSEADRSEILTHVRRCEGCRMRVDAESTAKHVLRAHATVAHATAPLPLFSAIALAGGMALFYLGDVAYRWRDHRQVPVDRTVTGVAAAATLPALLHMPAIGALVLLTGIGVCRLVWELWRRPRIGPVVAGQAR